MIILQTAGDDRYAGPLIEGRFQVMESLTKGSYFIADHLKADYILRANSAPDSPIQRYPTIEEAEEAIRILFTSEPEKGRAPIPVTKESPPMSATVSESAPEKITLPVKTAEPPRRGRPPKIAAVPLPVLPKKAVAKASSPAVKAPAAVKASAPAGLPAFLTRGKVIAPAPVAAPKKTAVNNVKPASQVAKLPDKARTAPVPDGKKLRVGEYTQELILKGLDNAAVIAELNKKFPEKANSLSNVCWYRSKLRKDGKLGGGRRRA